MDYLTREQIQRLHDLKSERNANRFLNSMSEYLCSFKYGKENVYYLNKAGRERVNSNVIRAKTLQIEHFLLRNQFRIYQVSPSTWKNEVLLKTPECKETIVADAMFYYSKTEMVFVEIDVNQPMKVNREKMVKYKKIRDASQNDFHVIWVTAIESRKSKLQVLFNGIPGRVYTANEIK